MSNPLADAESDVNSVVELLTQLVRCPSRGGVDDCRPAVELIEQWHRSAGLSPRVLSVNAEPVAVVSDVQGARPGPHLVLDACLDTAGIGDALAWSRDPFSAEIVDGWMYGRGTADSKAAVSVFSHLAAHLALTPDAFAGTVSVLFDLDEHTGGFAGIRTYLDSSDDIDAVMIGYPGPDSIVIGGRGFLRARATIYGQAGHSGSSRSCGVNAVTKAASLIGLLAAEAPTNVDPDLGLPPKVTVTSIRGGEPGHYSVLPDRCEVEVDVRLTPGFDAEAAWRFLGDVVAEVDALHAAPRPSTVEQTAQPWPAFRLPPSHRLTTALEAGAQAAGLAPLPVVAGPSNIGCLLASRGIPATAGFGVTYRALHGTDEAIEVASIPRVQAAYHQAVLDLQGPAIRGGGGQGEGPAE